MLPAMRIKEQRFFPGNRQPVLEVICPKLYNRPLESLAPISRQLLEASPYGNAFGTRILAYPEFAFGLCYRLEMSVGPATREIAALCAEKDAIVVFNIVEGTLLPSMRVADPKINYGYIASKGGMKKEKKIEYEAAELDVSRRAIDKNGLHIVSLVCDEATLELKNTREDQIAIVPAYGFPAVQAMHNSGIGKAMIVNDSLLGKACGEFREGDFWMKRKGEGVTYFWLWE